MNQKITFESVGIGHPDKMCDQMSDLILDSYLAIDPEAKVACEVMAANRLIVIGGEITANAEINRKQIVKNFLKKLNYNPEDFFIIDNVNQQSPDIAQAVIKDEIMAGDQGIVYGFACNETEEKIPLGQKIANLILEKLTEKAATNSATLGFDMKSQVTIGYENNKPKSIDVVLVSCQHKENKENDASNIINQTIDEVISIYDLDKSKTKKLINPSGKFVIGGPIGDTGLTGRKIIVDTYGGIARHGGGAFSGKDPSKVDRTGAYYARLLAKTIVDANYADKCEVQLAFAIGSPVPVAFFIETFGTEKVETSELYKLLINKKLIWTVDQMIKNLELKNPIFANTATFGHFGRKENWAKWEKTNI